VKRIIEPTVAALAFGLDKKEKGDRKITFMSAARSTFHHRNRRRGRRKAV
jgi:hypothetical protein